MWCRRRTVRSRSSFACSLLVRAGATEAAARRWWRERRLVGIDGEGASPPAAGIAVAVEDLLLLVGLAVTVAPARVVVTPVPSLARSPTRALPLTIPELRRLVVIAFEVVDHGGLGGLGGLAVVR